ncbi:MAG: 30S ribosome-binding factor RbfA [Chloroflexi bacterium]|jgi:ribosome-binding factor A|nr:30S ribosome-binding factor RbfA [Chloroflexota bacterium]
MNTYRKDRANTFIQEELTLALARQVKDPRVTNLSVTAVELTADKRVARVFVSALGGEEALREGLEGLRSASGVLRHHLSQVLHWRFTPYLEFRVDRSLEYGARIEAIFQAIAEERAAGADASDDEPDAEPDEGQE